MICRLSPDRLYAIVLISILHLSSRRPYMKVVGIIAEYNPFHKGHAYQIRYAKERLGADYVIVAMSGPFTQRGTPALFDKYSRQAMPLPAVPTWSWNFRSSMRPPVPRSLLPAVWLFCKMQGWWIPSYSAANVLILRL